ncbi:uncharacterized protein LOC144633196 [Oculina patagonica]
MSRTSSVFFATMCVLIISVTSSAETKREAKVLILGAGLSGITAAKTLLDNNITDFYVLEGQDYIGGRIHAMQFEGITIETGANWLHLLNDEDTAPLAERLIKTEMTGVWCNYSDIIIRDETGEDITDWEVIRKFDKEIEEKLEEFQLARKRRHEPDIPARVGLQLMGWKSNQPIEKVLEYFRLDFEHAKQPDLVSFYQLFSRGKDFFVSDLQGLWSLYEDLYKPVMERTILQETVEKIRYSDHSVELHTKSNETFVADYALCTFSSGVLASDTITFDPPLPKWKREAIYKNPMSVYTKIFLKFPRKFWDDNEYILHASKRQGYFSVFQDLDRPGILPKSGILLITVTGDEGRRIEEQTDHETKTEIMKTLRKIYGEKIPDPTAIFYHRWSKDPLTLGAYSEPVVGTTPQDFENLGEKLGRLYFAGEATSKDWYGYMQGAYLTGQDKGQMIADDLMQIEEQKTGYWFDETGVHEEL